MVPPSGPKPPPAAQSAPAAAAARPPGAQQAVEVTERMFKACLQVGTAGCSNTLTVCFSHDDQLSFWVTGSAVTLTGAVLALLVA